MSEKSEINATMLLPSFISKFDILFSDPEFGFKADRNLIALLLASLRLENLFDTEDGICDLGIVL